MNTFRAAIVFLFPLLLAATWPAGIVYWTLPANESRADSITSGSPLCFALLVESAAHKIVCPSLRRDYASQEYAIPWASNVGVRATVDAQGNLYFTDPEARRLGVMQHDTLRLTFGDRLEGYPFALVHTRESVWVAMSGSNLLARIGTDASIAYKRLSSDGVPVAIASSRDALYVLENNLHRIVSVKAEHETVMGTIRGCHRPTATPVMSALHSEIWFAVPCETHGITRWIGIIHANATGSTPGYLSLPQPLPVVGIAPDGMNGAWLTLRNESKLAHISAGGAFEVYTTSGPIIGSPVLSSSGAMFFLEGSANRVGEVDLILPQFVP